MQWLESEIMRLSHLQDWAREKGRKKEYPLLVILIFCSIILFNCSWMLVIFFFFWWLGILLTFVADLIWGLSVISGLREGRRTSCLTLVQNIFRRKGDMSLQNPGGLHFFQLSKLGDLVEKDFSLKTFYSIQKKLLLITFKYNV